ncbi:WhiB family transcriptional regulator, partial [Micromonospora sp. NPDC047707]|uniref:WhiB family transcriptional regulator n=1 Tax=Micromonospora sp. NPDC047707 TaxID=3154498 RepID=UPI00345458A0
RRTRGTTRDDPPGHRSPENQLTNSPSNPGLDREATKTPACRSHDTDLFFPGPATGGEMRRQIAQAKQICFTCPLLHPCRAWALNQPAQHLHGIWGATTQPERRLLQRQHRKTSQTAVANNALNA